MLGIPLLGIGLHVLTVAVLAFGLSGLSVGMGACLPNFRESDPSKIAAGFGGTLNLVAGLLFLILVLGCMAVPWHLVRMLSELGEISTVASVSLVGGGLVLGLAVGAAGVILPLHAGIKALREMEF